MTATPTTPAPEHADIVAEIVLLRAEAERLSRNDPKRDEIDERVDALVDRVLEARG